MAQSADSGGLIKFADRAFDAGRMQDAIRGYSKAMESGTLSMSEVAFALYRRGAAYRAVGRNAAAIADLTKALWIKELKGKSRSDVYRVRGEAYAALGRSTEALDDLKAAVKADPSNAAALRARGNLLAKLGKRDQASRDLERAAKREAAAKAKPGTSGSGSTGRPAVGDGSDRSAPSGPTISANEAESGESGVSGTLGAVTDYIGSLFSSSSSDADRTSDVEAETTTAEPPAAASRRAAAKPETAGAPERLSPTRRAPAPPPEQPSTSWTTSVERQAAPQEDGSDSTLAQVGRFFGSLFSSTSEDGGTDAAPAATGADRTASGGPQPLSSRTNTGKQFNLQLASLKTEAEAKASLNSIKSKHSALLAGRTPEIKTTKIEGLGTFYLVMLGPFDDRGSSLKLCNSFKQKGIRCFLVAN